MNLLAKYLKPLHKLMGLALLLAGLSQVLALVDPIIFGWLIDDYANQRHVKSDEELVRGALRCWRSRWPWRSPRAPARRCRIT